MNSEINLQTHNIINEHAELELDNLKFLKTSDITEWGKLYNIISIIGSQSSGKSTLLNNLFGTKFDVLLKGKQQTTKGIWLARDKEMPLLIMDVEGSDSKERWDERNFYEQSTALFALAISQVLLINIWTQEIGRFNASQYGIIKIIFEMNIKLFQQDSTKEILFVFRDYSEEDDFETISKIVSIDVQKIWDEIEKPPHLQNVPCNKIFKINFHNLSSFKYAKPKFMEDIKDMRKQLFTSKSSPSYFFKDFPYDSNLPIDALPLYMEKVWGTIKTNKDLNLPSQKIMVANLRCSQIKLEALEAVQEKLTLLKKKVNSGIDHQFGETGAQILQIAISYFDENAKHYAKEVFEEKGKELEANILNEIFHLYEIQLRNVKKLVFSEYSQKLESLQLEKGKMNQVMQQLKEVREQTLNLTHSLLFKSVVKEGAWGLEETLNEINSTFENQERGYVEKLLTLFIKFKENQLKRQLERAVNSYFDDLNEDFWKKIDECFFKVLNNCEEEVLNNLKNSFALPASSSNKYVEILRDEVYQSVEYEVQKKCQDLNYYLNKKFKNLFSRNENGTPRNWRLVEEEEIERIFMEAKEQTIKFLQMFRFFQLLKKKQDQPNELLGSTGRRDSALEGTFQFLLSESDFQKINNKLIDDTDNEYKEALRKHHAKDAGGVPKWFWAVLIFFMYDDVFRWMGSWYMIYPFLIIMTFVGFSFAIGYGDLPKILLESLFSKLNGLFGAKFMGLMLRLGLK